KAHARFNHQYEIPLNRETEAKLPARMGGAPTALPAGREGRVPFPLSNRPRGIHSRGEGRRVPCTTAALTRNALEVNRRKAARGEQSSPTRMGGAPTALPAGREGRVPFPLSNRPRGIHSRGEG